MSRTALFAGSAFRRTGASVTVEQCRGCYRHYSKKSRPLGRGTGRKSFLGAHSDHDQKQQHNPHLVGGAGKSASGEHGKHIPWAHALKLAVPAGKDRYKEHQKPDIFHLLQNTNGFFLNIRDGLFYEKPSGG